MLAGVAGGCSGPGSRGVAGSLLAEQLKEGEAGGLLIANLPGSG